MRSRFISFVIIQYTVQSTQYIHRWWSWSHLRSSLIRFVRLRNADRWILCSLQTELSSSDIRHNHIIINIISTTTKTNTVKSWSLKFQMTNFYFGFWTFTVTRRGFFDWSNWFLCQTRFIIWIFSVFLQYIPMQWNIHKIDKYVQIGHNLSRRKTGVLEKQKTWSWRQKTKTWWSVREPFKNYLADIFR